MLKERRWVVSFDNGNKIAVLYVSGVSIAEAIHQVHMRFDLAKTLKLHIALARNQEGYK